MSYAVENSPPDVEQAVSLFRCRELCMCAGAEQAVSLFYRERRSAVVSGVLVFTCVTPTKYKIRS